MYLFLQCVILSVTLKNHYTIRGTVKHCPVVQQDKKVRKKAMKYISMPNDPDSCPNIKVTDSENDTD